MTSQVTTDDVNAAIGSENDNKFLTFRLGEENYGVHILRVREIIGLIEITALPRTPDYVKGVINLRGKIIPVVQLRVRFGLEEIEDTESTCIIVVEVENAENDDKHQVGVIVDSVSEVLDIPPGGIEPAPRFASEVECNYIHGMGKVPGHEGEADEVVVLLDLDNILVTSLLKASGNSDPDTTAQDASQAA
ncbi:MAG: chemotaxis protein CheW [Planctomycetota bacterium]